MSNTIVSIVLSKYSIIFSDSVDKKKRVLKHNPAKSPNVIIGRVASDRFY